MITLSSFKKANKERRLKWAQLAGYKTVEEFMEVLSGEKSTPKKTKVSVNKAKKTEVLTDYVIAWDTTGSMNAYIDSVKKHVKDLVPVLFSNTENLLLKAVAFGDYCDMKSATEFGPAYQESAFTNNENDLIQFITNTKNTSGGDGDEFYELVIKKIVEETPWREGSVRTVLLIADASPHPVGYSYKDSWGNNYIVKNAQIDWKHEAVKARARFIKFDTLAINKGQQWYRELSQTTGGTYAPFSNSSKTSEAIEASMYFSGASAGSKMSMRSFSTKMDAAVESGDLELIGMYKTFSSKL